MGNTAANVIVGKPAVNGAVFRAPLGTTLPSDATTDLSSAFKCMGYISDDGVVHSMTRDGQDIKAWGGDTVLHAQTGKTDTWQMTFIESLNIDVMKAVYGDTNVTGSTLSGGITTKENSLELEHAVWVINRRGADGVKERTIIPDGQVTNIADVTYKDDTAVGYQVTITAYPYSGYSGDTSRTIKIKSASGGSSSQSGVS